MISLKRTLLPFQILVFICCFALQLNAETQPKTTIRAAIDLGMGGPKLQIAEVDVQNNKIIQVLHTQRIFVDFYHLLSDNNNKFSDEAMQEGLKAFQTVVNVAKSYQAESIVAIATESLRAASNGNAFANLIECETHIKVHILDQRMEGLLAFHAILSKLDVSPYELVMWDIGGGSMQFVTQSKDGSYLVEHNKEGVGFFKDHIIKHVQNRNVSEYKSPNPMSKRDIESGKSYARQLSNKMGKDFKDKFNNPNTKIIGVGSVFGYGISGMMGNKKIVTLADLSEVVANLEGKTDADLGGGDFACVEGTNCILVLGYMEELKMPKLQIVNVNIADGLLIYSPF